MRIYTLSGLTPSTKANLGKLGLNLGYKPAALLL